MLFSLEYFPCHPVVDCFHVHLVYMCSYSLHGSSNKQAIHLSTFLAGSPRMGSVLTPWHAASPGCHSESLAIPNLPGLLLGEPSPTRHLGEETLGQFGMPSGPNKATTLLFPIPLFLYLFIFLIYFLVTTTSCYLFDHRPFTP